jgi:TetR/AcrR family transcriptional repressor of mexCD-oprJ operon
VAALEEQRRGRVGVHVRETLLEAVAELLAERRAVPTMTEVAEAAGVGRATLYRYFPSRESLLQALFLATKDEAVQRLREAHLDAVPFPEALARATRALVTSGSRFVVLMREGGIRKHHEGKDELRARMRRLLARGRREGYLRAEVSARWTEVAFGATLLAGLEHAYETGTGVEDTAALVTQQFLDGAATRGNPLPD